MSKDELSEAAQEVEDVIDDVEAEIKGISVKRWARAISPAHEKALQLLEGRELAAIRRGLSALAKIERLAVAVKAMDEVKAKLDRKVEA